MNKDRHGPSATRILNVSHTLWVHVLPWCVPQLTAPLVAYCCCHSKFSHNDIALPLSSKDPDCNPFRCEKQYWYPTARDTIDHSRHFENTPQLLLTSLGEVFFPLLVVSAKLLLRICGGDLDTAMDVVSSIGSLRMARWLFDRATSIPYSTYERISPPPILSITDTADNTNSTTSATSTTSTTNTTPTALYPSNSRVLFRHIQRQIPHDWNTSQPGALCFSCSHGHLEFAKWFAEASGVSPLQVEGGNVLNFACAGGNTECVKWLLTFPVNKELFVGALGIACGVPSLEIAKLLVESHNFNKNDEEDTSSYLEEACASCSVPMCEWVKSHLAPHFSTHKAPRYIKNFLLATMRGKQDCLAVICWIKRMYISSNSLGPTHSLDIKARILEVMSYSCNWAAIKPEYDRSAFAPSFLYRLMDVAIKSNNLNTAKSIFPLITSPIIGTNWLSVSCDEDLLEAFLWLNTIFSFPAEEACLLLGRSLVGSAKKNHKHKLNKQCARPTPPFLVANHLLKSLTWTPQDMCNVLLDCCRQGCLEGMKWVMEKTDYDFIHDTKFTSDLLLSLQASCNIKFYCEVIEKLVPSLLDWQQVTDDQVLGCLRSYDPKPILLKNLSLTHHIPHSPIPQRVLDFAIRACCEDKVLEVQDTADSIFLWEFQNFNLHNISQSCDLWVSLCDEGDLFHLTILGNFVDQLETEELPVQLLLRLCIEGHLECARWISEKFSIKKEVLRPVDFTKLCKTGTTEAIQWYAVHFELTKADMENISLVVRSLGRCRERAELVEWFVKKFQVTFEEVSDLLKRACPQWLHKIICSLSKNNDLESEEPQAGKKRSPKPKGETTQPTKPKKHRH
ncbi:hypothetical protein Pelo_14011 [Pelomyxa schiedti]|nr:hypothetical protein Pelo_14011 [Pelomyxa schiedti]